MQDMVFLYGDHMKNLLKTLNVFSNLKNHTTVGNYRLSYYKNFKNFYDTLIDTEIFSKLDPNKKTILYAPTWKDSENSSSFFFVLNKLIEKAPSNYNLIIKPHPNLEDKNPVEFYKIFPTQLLPNIFWLQDFPLIYPLLNKCDIYLGDFSSIGYDFLYYQKPMFFIDPFDRDPQKDPSLFLHSCGNQIKTTDLDNIFTVIEKNQNSNFQEKQKKLYDLTFDKYLEIPKIKENILKNI
jgi:CDP-glycerol glycerophosphotransferase (TagB/SpsB family)